MLYFFLFIFFLSCVLKETCRETSRGAAIEGACFRAVFSGSPFSKTTGKNKHAASLTILGLGGDRPTLDSKAVFAYRSSLGFRSRALRLYIYISPEGICFPFSFHLISFQFYSV